MDYSKLVINTTIQRRELKLEEIISITNILLPFTILKDYQIKIDIDGLRKLRHILKDTELYDLLFKSNSPIRDNEIKKNDYIFNIFPKTGKINDLKNDFSKPYKGLYPKRFKKIIEKLYQIKNKKEVKIEIKVKIEINC